VHSDSFRAIILFWGAVMLTFDIPAMLIGALLFGIVLWALYNYTHPQPGRK